MALHREPLTILLVEDSEHDLRAIQRVWSRNGFSGRLIVVKDGEECLRYLRRRPPHDDPHRSPRPHLLLLDINLPRVNGFEVLKTIKGSSELQALPVVVFTTSRRHEDMIKAYQLGANAFFSKPLGSEALGRMLTAILQFWELAGLPVHHPAPAS